jgi:hypothetical protein
MPVMTHHVDHGAELPTSGSDRLEPSSSAHPWRPNLQLGDRTIDVVGDVDVSRDTSCPQCSRKSPVRSHDDEPHRRQSAGSEKRSGEHLGQWGRAVTPVDPPDEQGESS